MRTQFDSGLTMLIDSVHGSPVAAFQVWIHTGSYDEREGEHGLAHLHEHMLFKGTPTRGVGEVASAIEACGGQINAWTSNDHTCYHVVLPAHEWRNGLEVLADVVCHPLFDPDEMTREIEVVVEEIKRAADSPGQVAYRRLFEMTFAGHPYALPVLGTEAQVRGMTPEKMRAFWSRHYVTGNTTVVASGDLDPLSVREAITALFADLPRRDAAPKPQPEPLPIVAAADVLATAFSESRVVYGWPLPSLEHPDVPALDILAIALGQGDSSRLVRTVQRDLLLVNDIGCSTYTPQRVGLFSLTLLTSIDRLDAARPAALQVLADVLARGITRAELDKARNNILSDATYKLETVQGLAHSHGYFHATTGDPAWARVYDRRVAEVSLGDVLRVARCWLRPDTVQIVQMPGTDAAHAEDAPQHAHTLDPASLLAEAQAILAPAVAADLLPGSIVGLALRTPDIVHGIERIELPTGDLLLVQPDRSVAICALRVAALGGLRSETAANNGSSHLLAQLLTRGTARRSGAEIAHEIETLAAGLGGFAGRNSFGLHAVTLSGTRDAVLDLMFDTLFEATLPEVELETERRVQLEDIRHHSDAPARQALRAMASALYGDHPYGLDMLGTAESVGSLQPDTLLADLRQRLAPGRLVYAAAGDVDAEELAIQIVARAPTDRTPQPPLESRPVLPLTGPVQLRMTSEKQQAHLALGFLGTTLYDKDRYALDVLSTILSGQSGRLFVELRDRQSLAYTVSAMHVDGLDPGYFALYIGTSPDKAETAMRGLNAELDKVLQAQVSANELDRARRYLAGGHAIGLQRRTSRASTFCLNELYGLGRDAWRGQLDSLLAVSAEDILHVARKYLDRERSVEVVLAPK